MKKHVASFLFFLLFATLFPAISHALNVENHRYHFQTGRADLLVESTPKPKDTLTLGLGTSLAVQPFEFGSSVGASPRSIVDFAASFSIGAAYSFSDSVAVGVNIPFHVTSNIQSLTNLAKESVMSFGDVSIAGQYRLVSRDDNNLGFGFALVPFLSFPTGSSGNFMGDASATGGMVLAGDIENNGHYVGLNLGVRFRKEENFLNLRVAQEFTYVLAYHHAILADQQFDGFGEIAGSTVMNEFFQNGNSSPIEIKAGISKVFMPDTPITVKFINGIGVTNGYGNPDYRAVIQLTYDHFLPRTKIIEKTVTVERVQRVEQQLKDLTIYYPTDGAQVDPFYDQKIAGIAKVMKENPDMGPLYIVGHTDDVGNDEYNRKLSEKRARQANDSIAQHGLAPKDIVWFGVGETDHIAPNDSEANRALNRRTVFTFQKPRQISERANGAVSSTRTPFVSSPVPVTNKPVTDSYTETLKRREAVGGFVDDSVRVEPVRKKEEVRVKEETRVIKGEDDRRNDSFWDSEKKSNDYGNQDEPKRKKKKSRKHKKGYQEKNLNGDENFDEPFVE